MRSLGPRVRVAQLAPHNEIAMNGVHEKGGWRVSTFTQGKLCRPAEIPGWPNRASLAYKCERFAGDFAGRAKSVRAKGLFTSDTKRLP